MRKFFAIVLGLSTITATATAQSSPKVALYQVVNTGEERYVGLMYDEDSCLTVAQMLNVYVRLDPPSPFIFVCRPRTVRS